MERSIVNPPDAARLIEGMRDTGYEFKTAVADIIDNSIAANATHIYIYINSDIKNHLSLAIIDNGDGMNENELISAMRYGSSQRPHPQSLGKFGLGLKTASTAFCRRLSVISTNSGKEFHKVVWDLDHVVKKNDWELLIEEPNKTEVKLLKGVTDNKSGTLVVWEKIDRLLKKYKIPGGRAAINALKQHKKELRDHLGMVYQRFLDPSDKRVKNKVKIFIDDEEVVYWNPFKYADESAKDSPTITETRNGEEVKVGKFDVQTYIFPRTDEMTDEQVNYADISLSKQGIYVYRENRLIYGPDWLGGANRHNQLNQLRVEFSFDHKLDDLFQIDIKKSSVSLSEELHEWLFDKFLKPPMNFARNLVYAKKKDDIAKKAQGIHDPSNTSIRRKEDDVKKANIAVDNKTGKVSVENAFGSSVYRTISPSKLLRPGELFVQPVENILDGLLWEPTMIEGHSAVKINTSHPYYQKVYSYIIGEKNTIKGLDYLLWALVQAEYNAFNPQAEKYIESFRLETSRVLRQLVEDLPDPDTE